MPRTARIVVPGIAARVTQRGNRRQQTFFCEADYCRYIELVGEGCRNSGVHLLAWYLMPNHAHLVLVTASTEAMSAALSWAHRRYTWLVKRRNGWRGYVWQSRSFSCPLDDAHLRLCMRYVELNPVRAGIVAEPQNWRWSSAAGHIKGTGDRLVSVKLPRAVADVQDWASFLAEGIADDELDRMRSLHSSGRPRGRPPKVRDENGDTYNFDFYGA